MHLFLSSSVLLVVYDTTFAFTLLTIVDATELVYLAKTLYKSLLAWKHFLC